MTPALRPGSIGTKNQTSTCLQHHHSPQTNGFSLESTGAREVPASNAETVECCATHTLLWVSQCLCGPNWPPVCHVREGYQSAVRQQHKNSLLALHGLTTDRAFDWTKVGNGSTKRIYQGLKHSTNVWLLLHDNRPILQNLTSQLPRPPFLCYYLLSSTLIHPYARTFPVIVTWCIISTPISPSLR